MLDIQGIRYGFCTIVTNICIRNLQFLQIGLKQMGEITVRYFLTCNCKRSPINFAPTSPIETFHNTRIDNWNKYGTRC